MSRIHPIVQQIGLATAELETSLLEGRLDELEGILGRRQALIGECALTSLSADDRRALAAIEARGQDLLGALCQARSEAAAELARPAARRRAVRSYRKSA